MSRLVEVFIDGAISELENAALQCHGDPALTVNDVLKIRKAQQQLAHLRNDLTHKQERHLTKRINAGMA